MYEKILDFENSQKGKVDADESDETWQLRLSGLVIKKNDYLKISNQIYKRIFGRKWINKELDKWLPFTQKLRLWIGSEDESLLLKDQELKDALLWANDKSLNDDAYNFLMASQSFENKQLQHLLNSQELKSSLTEANLNPEVLKKELQKQQKLLEEEKEKSNTIKKQRDQNKFYLKIANLLIYILILPSIIGCILGYFYIDSNLHKFVPRAIETETPKNNLPSIIQEPKKGEDCKCP